MPDSDAHAAARMGPLALVHRPIDDLPGLRAAVQRAIEVEFTTVPAYLAALYSLQDAGSAAYQALLSVVVEEMFHMNQAANLLVGIGGSPSFTGAAVPTYPTYLPSASRIATPYVGLYRASQSVFENVFMAIETPAPFAAPAEGEHYRTIGQFYKAVTDGLETCVAKYGPSAVFAPLPGLQQRTDIYIGKFGGRAIEVTDLASAKAGIQQIVQQGEGAVDPTRTLVPVQPFGTYHYYGRRLDGTYGPIMGTPYELSHYFKFKQVAGADGFPPTYPTLSNPRLADYANPAARQTAELFNLYYTVMLNSLERCFRLGPAGRDLYFEITLPLMHNHLPKLAQQLATLPVQPDGDPSVGPTAAPTFEYVPDTTMAGLLGAIGALRGTAEPPRARLAPAGRASATAAAPPGDRGRAVLGRLESDLASLKQVSDAAGFGL